MCCLGNVFYLLIGPYPGPLHRLSPVDEREAMAALRGRHARAGPASAGRESSPRHSAGATLGGYRALTKPPSEGEEKETCEGWATK